MICKEKCGIKIMNKYFIFFTLISMVFFGCSTKEITGKDIVDKLIQMEFADEKEIDRTCYEDYFSNPNEGFFLSGMAQDLEIKSLNQLNELMDNGHKAVKKAKSRGIDLSGCMNEEFGDCPLSEIELKGIQAVMTASVGAGFGCGFK